MENVQSDYKNLKGMYPSAAEKLASNGPYNSVKDIYKIKDLTGKFHRWVASYFKLPEFLPLYLISNFATISMLELNART